MQEVLQKSVFRLLRPLARLLLRHGVSHAEFADWAKQAFVREAEQNFGVGGKKTTVSRIATVTGINRKEVKRIQELPADISTLSSKHNRAARVVTGWLQDTDFLDESGQAKPLEYGDPDKPFNQLVKRYSGDVPHKAMLKELQLNGILEMLDKDNVTLQANAYIPNKSEEERLALMGQDISELIKTIDHNHQSTPEQAYYQRKVCYDNLPLEAVEQFRSMANEDCQALLIKFNSWLVKHDRDSNPAASGTGRIRAGVGLHYFEEDMTEQGQDTIK